MGKKRAQGINKQVEKDIIHDKAGEEMKKSEKKDYEH